MISAREMWALCSVLLALCCTGTLGAQQLLCSGSNLEGFVACVTDSARLAAADSDIYAVPGSTEMALWKTLFNGVLDASDSTSCLTLSPTGTGNAFDGIYEVVVVASEYCVAYEVLDSNDDGIVDRGWDMIISPFTSLRGALHLQVPHVISDALTSNEAAVIMEGARVRSMQVSGARRDASTTVSPCDSSHWESDAAHNTALFHFASTEVMAERSGDVALQFHAMASTSCSGVDAFLTYGSNSLSTEDWDANVPLRLMAESLIAQSWSVTVPGGHLPPLTCNLAGTTNPGGRHLNGVPSADVCTTSSDGAYTKAFIHIEQKLLLRQEPDDMLTAVLAAFPEDPSNPSATSTAAPTPSSVVTPTPSQTTTATTTATTTRSVGSSASVTTSRSVTGPRSSTPTATRSVGSSASTSLASSRSSSPAAVSDSSSGVSFPSSHTENSRVDDDDTTSQSSSRAPNVPFLLLTLSLVAFWLC